MQLEHPQSTISILPPEVLSNIFLFVCPPDEYHSAHHKVPTPDGKLYLCPAFVLCAVSVYWRQIAISTPLLWEKLDLSVCKGNPQVLVPKFVELLKVYSERSLGHLLDLKIWTLMGWRGAGFYPLPDDPSIGLNDIEHAVFIGHSNHIQKLNLLAVDTKWRHLVQLLTQLTELRVHLTSGHGSDYSLLDFEDFSWWDKLTVADLTGVYLPQCHQILAECPNLIEFHVQKSIFFPWTQKMHPMPQASPQYLERFDWEFTQLYWETALLTHVRLPSLKRFCWKTRVNSAGYIHPHARSLFYTNLSQFLSASSETLIELDFRFTTIIDDDIQTLVPTIIASTPKLRRLALSCHSPSKSAALTTTLLVRALSARSDYLMVPLPGLERLHFQIPVPTISASISLPPKPTQGEIAESRAVLVGMIRQRRERTLIESFRLDLDFNLLWDTDTVEELRGLMRGGLRLEIVQASGPVDLLSG